MASTRRPIGSSSGARSTCARTRKWQRCSIACVVTFTAKAPAMIASGKSARIVNGGNGVGSAQPAKRLRVGHRGHHGTRLKAGNASQRRKTSPVRQLRPSCKLVSRFSRSNPICHSQRSRSSFFEAKFFVEFVRRNVGDQTDIGRDGQLSRDIRHDCLHDGFPQSSSLMVGMNSDVDNLEKAASIADQSPHPDCRASMHDNDRVNRTR